MPHSQDSDAREDRAALDGDVAAFERVFRRFHAQLCEVVASYVHSPEVAEEIVQDLFLALWTSGGRYEVRGSLRGYLFTAARNRAIQHLRHEGIILALTNRSMSSDVSPGMGQPTDAPDQRAMERESRLALQRAISALPARTRTALILRWEHALSHAEVAEAMGISLKGVEKLLSVAMGKLRRSMRDG
ncbi:MAG: sigma-70 family RNA polymerase sigma factor [bacterium]